MDWIEYSIPFLFSSDPASGANNVSSNGSSFEVLLDQPLVIPKIARNCYVTVQTATAWWNIFNIEAGVNDKIRVIYFDGVLTVDQTLTVDPGLYDLAHLSEELARELNANGYPSDLFILTPDQATQKVVIQFNYTGVQLDLSVAQNFATLLGFDERLVPLAGQTATTLEHEKGDSVARFNNTEYLLVHSDLVARGIRVNSRYSNTVARILIDQPPGSQLVSIPFNPPKIPSPELVSEVRRNIRFWLTDQNNQEVDTQGEYFSLELLVHYSVPITTVSPLELR